jgi:DNA-directed RNA polymerase specialized sigma24 family protein
LHFLPLAFQQGVVRDPGRAEEPGELKQVEDSYRLALELFYFPDLSYKEIAATLGLPSAVT